MKILHTADWHLGTFRSPVKDGVNLRTEDGEWFRGQCRSMDGITRRKHLP